jgi:hypothetical protein
MRRAYIIAMILVLLADTLPMRAGEVIDRIIAVVNNTPVLLSDWDEIWRCEALLAGRSPESYSALEQQDMFNRLVDQELLREQMRGLALHEVPQPDVGSRLHEVRTQLAGDSDAKWQATLQSAGVREGELRYHLRRQMELERFVDSRFRAGIRIEDRAVAQYYYNNFLPELHKAGGKDVPLDEVADKIREILVQQQIEEQLTAWIQTLREQADIRTPQEVSGETQSK